VRLTIARHEARLTQRGLAALIGLKDESGHITVCRYEAGVCEPQVSRLVKICEVLKVRAGWLLGIEDE
jgi:transcriptional regulator with XRE-family HTH domain